jgi:hypothetical protein
MCNDLGLDDPENETDLFWQAIDNKDGQSAASAIRSLLKAENDTSLVPSSLLIAIGLLIDPATSKNFDPAKISIAKRKPLGRPRKTATGMLGAPKVVQGKFMKSASSGVAADLEDRLSHAVNSDDASSAARWMFEMAGDAHIAEVELSKQFVAWLADLFDTSRDRSLQPIVLRIQRRQTRGKPSWREQQPGRELRRRRYVAVAMKHLGTSFPSFATLKKESQVADIRNYLNQNHIKIGRNEIYALLGPASWERAREKDDE